MYIVYSFFFNQSATTESYTYGHTLSRHYALPIGQHGSECSPALGLGIEAEKELRQAVHDEGPAGPPRIAAAAVIGDEGRVDDAPGDDPLADDPGRIEQYQGDKQAEGMRRCHRQQHPCSAGEAPAD